MFPTSTLPVEPFAGSIGMGTLLALLALGALVAMCVGLALHRRETKASTAIDVSEPDHDAAPTAKAPGARLNA
jgi:hypothetical protein